MRWLLLVLPLCLACQKQEAIANSGGSHQEQPGDQLDGPYPEDCLCNEIHALNANVDKLLKLLDKADWLPLTAAEEEK